MAAAACGAGSLSAEELGTEVTAICERVRSEVSSISFADNSDELRAQAFDVLGSFNDGREALSDLSAGEGQADVDALSEATGDVHADLANARTALELRNFDEAADSVASGRDALDRTDAAAAALGVDACGSETWGAGWFDRAEDVLAAEEQANAPTGDYETDVAAACGRFADDVADAPLFATNVVDLQLAAGSYSQALELLARDLSTFEPPAELAAAHEALVVALDDASDLMSEVLSSVNSASEEELADLQSRITSTVGELSARIGALGITC